jgi:NADPH-dependent 2,4-dienoyl-CoA reductase/sulfur reductase-like enzyme/rhodanese-related sulfurtransferase
MKLVIIGGVAGGASAAARARRIDEDAQIVLIERGEHVSFANCGLPYFIGGEIKDRNSLLVQTPESLSRRFNLDVRCRHEAGSIYPDRREIEVRNLVTGETYLETYDKLILSPGAAPFVPEIPGVGLNKVFTLRTVPDAEHIREVVERKKPSAAVVVGGGFIGLEMAENLHRKGIEVHLVELTEQVMISVDKDIAAFIHREIEDKGVGLHLSTGLEAVEQDGEELKVKLSTGEYLSAGMVILSVGVKPETGLAAGAGLALGHRGGIEVDEYLRTSDPDIYAVGDAIEIRDIVTGRQGLMPLAGPANKQGRIAADNALGGRNVKFNGSLGTSIVRVFDLVLARTGAAEKQLEAEGIDHLCSWTHSVSHASYYPGAGLMSVKLAFSPENGTLLGAQIVGADGVDKRIDVLATALACSMTVGELTELDLAYAPPFGSGKDPVNMAGYVASNILAGDVEIAHWHELNGGARDSALLVDVRTPAEFAMGHIPDAVNIPVDQLRSRLDELEPDRETLVYCRIGLRGYIAGRILTQRGFSRVRNLSGGYLTYSTVVPEETSTALARKSLLKEHE